MRSANDKQIKRNFKLSPARLIFFGFLAVILSGAILLTLPVSSRNGKTIGFTDALFTAISSTCVTGLVVVDTNTHWSIFGKTIILILIQTGALGVMSVTAIFSIITGRMLGLTQRMAIQESISNFSLTEIVKIFKGILAITLTVEGIGAIIVSFSLIPVYGFSNGVGKSIFHSISAFCNAGFDLFGTEANKFSSLTRFNYNIVMILITAFMIIFGGLGFVVWKDIAMNRKFTRLTLHSKLVLSATVFLLISGTAGYLALESNNSLAGMPFHLKILNSFFHSVSARTAGFNTINMDKINDTSGLLTIVLMFIGAAPGSTAGGIKITTAYVLILTVGAFLRGRHEVQVFKWRISGDVIRKSIAVFILSLGLVFLTTVFLLINNGGRLLQALFEATSAFGTVGLSTGITPDLAILSKYMLMITMLLGRIGTLTAVAAINFRQDRDNVVYRYPEGKITVG